MRPSTTKIAVTVAALATLLANNSFSSQRFIFLFSFHTYTYTNTINIYFYYSHRPCNVQYTIYTYNVSNILSARAQAQTHAHTHTPNTNDLRQNSYYWPTARPINLQQRRRRFYMSSFRTLPPPSTIVSCDGGFRERRVNELWRGRGRGKRTTTLSRIHFIIITRDGKKVKKKNKRFGMIHI